MTRNTRRKAASLALAGCLLLPALAGASPPHAARRDAGARRTGASSGPWQTAWDLLRSLWAAETDPGWQPPGQMPSVPGPGQGTNQEGAGLDPHGVPHP